MKSESESTGPAVVWSPEARSWVSLLLFVHLFAVVVAATSYTRPSDLQRQLHELFAPYLRTLHLTANPVTYPFARFYFTHLTPGDLEFTWDFDIATADGSRQVQIPPRGVQPLVRYRRYQALANAAGALATEPDGDEANLLPKVMTGAILRDQGATEATVRCRGHELPEMDAYAQVDARRKAALENFREIYEARVFLSDGAVELIRKSAKLEVAPVEKQSQPPSRPLPQSLPPSQSLPQQ